jgi:DNA-binding transcriptional LysR family regulator
MNVELRNLRALVAVVDAETFTDAAIELGTSQAAVSRSIAALEQALGLRILQRTTRSFTLTEGRFNSTPIGAEARFAALAASDPLARRRVLRMADFAGRTIAVDRRTGTTSEELWAEESGPAGFRPVQGVDEWLTLISTGQALGMSSEATAAQNPRPGVAYRPVRDAPPIEVFLACWRDDPSPLVADFIRLARAAYTPG